MNDIALPESRFVAHALTSDDDPGAQGDQKDPDQLARHHQQDYRQPWVEPLGRERGTWEAREARETCFQESSVVNKRWCKGDFVLLRRDEVKSTKDDDVLLNPKERSQGGQPPQNTLALPPAYKRPHPLEVNSSLRDLNSLS
eukprot:gene12244-biopygen3344